MEEKFHILEVEEANQMNDINCYGQFNRFKWLIFVLCVTVLIALTIGVVVILPNLTSTEPDSEQNIDRTIHPEPDSKQNMATGNAGEY